MLLLSDKDFCAKISQSIDTFILTNKSDEISHLLFWETLKVVWRREIISYTSHKNSEQKKQLQVLTLFSNLRNNMLETLPRSSIKRD